MQAGRERKIASGANLHCKPSGLEVADLSASTTTYSPLVLCTAGLDSDNDSRVFSEEARERAMLKPKKNHNCGRSFRLKQMGRANARIPKEVLLLKVSSTIA